MDPADCLRSLAAGALIRSRSEGDLLPMSLGLQATANAFVMLGPLPGDGAESRLAVSLPSERSRSTRPYSRLMVLAAGRSRPVQPAGDREHPGGGRLGRARTAPL